MMKTGFKPIHTFLGESDTLAPLLAHHRRTAHLQTILVDSLPANLKASSRIAAWEGTTIVVATANGATAAMLKQMLPRLLEKFRVVLSKNQKQEQEVTSIRVVVQPETPATVGQDTPRPRATRPGEPMPIASLNQLSDSLDDSPLKQAVEKIRQRRSRTTRAK
jgi:hypothetical protein